MSFSAAKFVVFSHLMQYACDFRIKTNFVGVTEGRTYHLTTFQDNLRQKIFAKSCKGSPLMSFSTAEVRSFSHLMQYACDFRIKTSFVGVTEGRTYHLTIFQDNLRQKIFVKSCKGSPLMSFSTAEIRSFFAFNTIWLRFSNKN